MRQELEKAGRNSNREVRRFDDGRTWPEKRGSGYVAKGRKEYVGSVYQNVVVRIREGRFEEIRLLAATAGSSFAAIVRKLLEERLEEMGKLIIYAPEGVDLQTADALRVYFRKGCFLIEWDGARELPSNSIAFTSRDLRGALSLPEALQQAGMR